VIHVLEGLGFGGDMMRELTLRMVSEQRTNRLVRVYRCVLRCWKGKGCWNWECIRIDIRHITRQIFWKMLECDVENRALTVK
jgi:hypothetical protein